MSNIFKPGDKITIHFPDGSRKTTTVASPSWESTLRSDTEMRLSIKEERDNT
ncbi:hypothetical protein MOE50_05130 [Bacillus inaquosorum]|uniref:hypothetical protein n=2 Tax=Bacillus subtilis group TaxID=653685 RepID=UPI002282E773|nr:hypothetical protein [Bacillus inaquosorum]MCY9008385.1 hypothetical protein [Bacillus inaquosorum]MCY9038551.1 hypothetical protein [Bacillus inaquosorum]MCY9043799.1 hypothetical protein [Bacillus inaquosorum]